MSKQDLHNTLERLRAEVCSLENDVGPIKERVNSLISDLERQVRDLDDAEHDDVENAAAGNIATMRDRLAKLIGQVESKHPAITSMLEQIATSLGNIGI